MTRVHIRQGDLTALPADAIVNAASNDLLLGGGMAADIFGKTWGRISGPEG